MLKPTLLDERLTTPLVGWREWIALPSLGIERIKAKIDTGARSSSLHASDIESFEREGRTWIRFSVSPFQQSAEPRIVTAAPLIEYRPIRSSSGHLSVRPVVMAEMAIGEWRWNIELTLAARDEMGFRMLIGRQAVRNRLLVHSGQSFLLSQDQ